MYQHDSLPREFVDIILEGNESTTWFSILGISINATYKRKSDILYKESSPEMSMALATRYEVT